MIIAILMLLVAALNAGSCAVQIILGNKEFAFMTAAVSVCLFGCFVVKVLGLLLESGAAT